ncbi:pseudouridine synthase [Hymenobacter sp. 102]|uniref:pseudouridine synthase n=1 Tax=Hymenobacter sp. 102 TaxID=3403152 RepID=UPI003CEDA854
MGKKHFSGDAAGRKGRPAGSGRPSGNTEGFRKFMQPQQERAERDSRRDADRGGFGRSAGGNSYGGPKKFGNTGGYGGPKKFGGQNSFGNRENRPFRGDNDNAQRSDFNREERPKREFTPRETWQGQPYRQEGKTAVPRGLPGERNRKFVKQNPNPAPEPEAYRPRASEERPERSFGADREVRAARPFDFRGRPADLDGERAERPSRFEGDSQRERPARRESSFSSERRDFSTRKPQGFGGGAAGEKRTSRPGSFGDKRETRSFDRDDRKSFGNQRSFGTDRTDRREARPSEERPRRAHDEFIGKGPQTPGSNQAGKRKYGEVAGEAPDYKNLKHYEEDKNRGNKRRREEDDLNTGEVRLNRYIANAGICSRREADSLIAAGEIKVNGQVVTEMGYKVQPSDTVQYGKTNLNREKQVYVLLNKPKDYLTTTEDPEGRRTVMELIKGASKERVFPVGRLDRNTTGLLLFTNDGEVAQKLSHPSHRNKKIYQVELDKPLTPEHLAQIADGLMLEDGKAEVDDVAVVAGNPHFVGVEIHIGRNRIVRRIFEHLGYDVVTLDRVQYAGLTKKDLPRGKWRFLTEKEVIRLKYFM